MCLEVLVATGALLLGNILFGTDFEARTPKWRRILKCSIFVGVTALLSATSGRFWSFAWILSGLGVGTSFHFLWCRKHGIDPWTAEPRETYYALRGWKS